MDKGTACDRGHFLDGWHALPAAAVRLSLRSRTGFETVRDVQGDGAAIAPRNHQSCDDSDMACRTLSCLVRPLVFVILVSRQTSACSGAVGCPRFFRSLR